MIDSDVNTFKIFCFFSITSPHKFDHQTMYIEWFVHIQVVIKRNRTYQNLTIFILVMKPNKTLTEDLEFFIIFISKIIFISMTFNILFKKNE